MSDSHGFADFTHENFLDCWAMRNKEYYPSIWQIKACQIRIPGAKEGYEIRASWGVTKPYGDYSKTEHEKSAVVLRELRNTQYHCRTREDPFLREFKWMDIKDDPKMRDFVDKWLFYQHPGDPRPRRYHVEGNLWDLVNKRIRVWKDEMMMNVATKQKAPEGAANYSVWQEPDEGDEETDTPRRVLRITAA
ncbi:hypothetical protein HBI74_171690 [Parastagonospora nodorum]|nr:hypothetical protein HBI74_171690 [Parastagonospora nodorum]KAH5991341.1 hypothetical protein HBI84_167990 [Parastagonospora nodorum]